MSRLPFRISIAVFLWFSASLLLVVFIAVCFGASFSLRQVGKKASEVRQVILPEVEETQRSFINLEGLRRLAEVVYISEDPQSWRKARITAQAMATESVFTRNDDFYQRSKMLVAEINSLAAVRKQELATRKRLRELEKRFFNDIYRLVSDITDPTVETRITEAAFSLSLFQAGTCSASKQAAEHLSLMQTSDKQRFADLMRDCRELTVARSGLAPVCARLEASRDEYMHIMRALREDFTLAFAKWQSVDETLREMRDAVRTDAEFETKDALASIEATSAQAVREAVWLALGGVVFFLAYLFVLKRVIVRPLDWVGRKLAELQQGELHSPVPVMYITELYQVADLLDRFSGHLAELTSQASQLAEDAAAKRDLESLMSAVFQVSVEGYVIWAPSGLHTANGELLRVLKYKDIEELGAHWEEIGFTPRDEQPALYEKVIIDGFFRRELYARAADGERIPFEISYLPLLLQGEKWVLSYCRDLRQQKQTEEALRAARDKAEDATRVKSEFLARMSHEIRTPMNGVLGLTQIALADSPPPAQRQYLEKIQASARILLRVINDILDFSKLESGRFSLERRVFAFSDLMNTVKDLFAPQAEEKGLSYTIDMDRRVPEYVIGDELRLSQVLLNLCGNALKFTERGGVTLRVLLEEDTGAELRLRFSVTDTGLGMSAEQLASLFQPFSQADTSTTRKYGGTGLGLVISKLLVEMMRGRIEVNSQPGKGSTFSFDVLLEKCASPAANAEPGGDLPTRPEALSGLRILLVEDNEINQEVAATLLENLGCETTVAANGAEALQVLRDNRFDCVLMDIQMPVMDGLSATRRIRSDPREDVRALPIIAMTAHAMREDREKSITAGMDDHLTKPIDLRELTAVLLRVMARRADQL